MFGVFELPPLLLMRCWEESHSSSDASPPISSSMRIYYLLRASCPIDISYALLWTRCALW